MTPQIDYKAILHGITSYSLSLDDALDALTALLMRYTFVAQVLPIRRGLKIYRAVVVADPGTPPKLLIEVIGYGDSMIQHCIEKTIEVSTPAVNTIEKMKYENDKLYFLVDRESYWWVGISELQIENTAKRWISDSAF